MDLGPYPVILQLPSVSYTGPVLLILKQTNKKNTFHVQQSVYILPFGSTSCCFSTTESVLSHSDKQGQEIMEPMGEINKQSN